MSVPTTEKNNKSVIYYSWCKLSLLGSHVMVMVVFVLLNLLHPLSQPLHLLLQAVHLPLHDRPLSVLHLPLLPHDLLHCYGVDNLIVMKQDLECALSQNVHKIYVRS